MAQNLSIDIHFAGWVKHFNSTTICFDWRMLAYKHIFEAWLKWYYHIKYVMYCVDFRSKSDIFNIFLYNNFDYILDKCNDCLKLVLLCVASSSTKWNVWFAIKTFSRLYLLFSNVIYRIEEYYYYYLCYMRTYHFLHFKMNHFLPQLVATKIKHCNLQITNKNRLISLLVAAKATFT